MDNIDFNKLWQNYLDTITNHYSDMAGRIGRAQFWYFVLVNILVAVVVAVVGGILRLGSLIGAVYWLALLLPSVGMAARRIQDTGRSGSLAWLLAVPAIVSVLSALFWIFTIMTLGLGLILAPLMLLFNLAALAAAVVVIYFCAQPGEAGANAYGPPPPPWTPGSTAAPPAPSKT